MKQINGSGATVSGTAILCAAICAECIPALIICVAVAVGGAIWDVIHGNVKEVE